MTAPSLRTSTASDLGPDIGDYRAVSRLAVAALMLGLASVLALITPVLWFLPVLASVLGFAALVRIKQNAATLIGRKAALIAIALGVTFAVAAPARAISRGVWLGARARSFAEVWLDFLRGGQPYHAHQLTQSTDERLPLDEDLPSKYKEPDLKEDFGEFTRRPVAASLLRWRDGAELTYLNSEITYSSQTEDVVVLRYLLADPDRQEPTTARITLLRTVGPDGKERWRVTNQVLGEQER